jgi:trimethylamine:corrinoid methyltransferase-like protein
VHGNSGGSGEQALLSAACAQMSNEFYQLPSNVPTGMTDGESKQEGRIASTGSLIGTQKKGGMSE